jgi:Co/Zn/Cd efflux system component
VVGALAISCFLYALSLNIFLEAMKRFFYVEPLENPQLIVIVGGGGFFLFLGAKLPRFFSSIDHLPCKAY